MGGRLRGLRSSFDRLGEALVGRRDAGPRGGTAGRDDRPDESVVAHHRLEAIIERVSLVIYIKDREGRYLLINSAGEALFGRPREEIVGRRDDDLFGEAAAEIRSIDERVMATREPTSYESTRRVDGEERIFRNEKFPYVPDGKVVGVVGVSRDVTESVERQRAVERLHEATRELMVATSTVEVATVASETTTQILNLPFNGVHVYRPERDALVPIAWSDAAETILDAPPPEIRAGEGLAWEVYRSGEPRTYADVRRADAVLNEDTAVRSELFLPLGAHGILLIGSPTVDDFDETDKALSRVLAANVETAMDRVERERELERRNERLADFAAIVSHDIRNPLTVAEGRLDLAREECDSVHLDAVAAAQDRMGALVDDVLTWARDGQGLEVTEPVDVGELARESWGGVESGDATLSVGIDLVVEADRNRLRRLFENLFRNAIRYGGPAVSVRVGALSDAAGFFVEDDGPGILSGEREAVFEAGYTTSDDGTGFGLAIVEEVVGAHGWSIEATAAGGGGARFEVRGVRTRQ